MSPFALKISSTGSKIWSKVVGGLSSNSVGYSIVESGDTSGAIYLAGWTTAFAIPNPRDALLVKLNSSGALEWAKVVGGLGSNLI